MIILVPIDWDASSQAIQDLHIVYAIIEAIAVKIAFLIAHQIRTRTRGNIATDPAFTAAGRYGFGRFDVLCHA